MVASSPIVVFLHLVVALPRAPPPPALLRQNGHHPRSHTLSNGWLLSVSITCTPSSLSFALDHATAGSCNVESHLRKSSINPSSTNFNPTARLWRCWATSSQCHRPPPPLHPCHCGVCTMLNYTWGVSPHLLWLQSCTLVLANERIHKPCPSVAQCQDAKYLYRGDGSKSLFSVLKMKLCFKWQDWPSLCYTHWNTVKSVSADSLSRIPQGDAMGSLYSPPLRR